jgi:hypothetical protein
MTLTILTPLVNMYAVFNDLADRSNLFFCRRWFRISLADELEAIGLFPWAEAKG